MSRSTARHSPHFPTEKSLPPQRVPTVQPATSSAAPITEVEPGGARGPWIAMLIWFAAFLVLARGELLRLVGAHFLQHGHRLVALAAAQPGAGPQHLELDRIGLEDPR